MLKSSVIEFESGSGARIPILYEDRAVIAIDKPAGWMLAPTNWQRTQRNLQAAIESSIAASDFWARCRNLRYLRFVHRLDAETSGILLLAKSPGALKVLGGLFESRSVEKTYLAVVVGRPQQTSWTCELKLAPDPVRHDRVIVDAKNGKSAETSFSVRQAHPGGGLPLTLVEVRPMTGRTHQIRVHLAASGHPVVGDRLYGNMKVHSGASGEFPLGLRAVRLAYVDPFTRKRVCITADSKAFLRHFGFAIIAEAEQHKFER